MSEAKTAVYRLFDSAGALLYVGVAKNPKRRWRQHARKKPWWPQVAGRVVEWHPARLAALEAEAKAIKSEAPIHNIAVPDPADPMSWPPPDLLERQAEGARRVRMARAAAERCPDCGQILPPAKTCPGCGETFYRGEGGRTDAECCSAQCSARVRKRRQREREAALREGGR